jgi:hypothetical protein
MFWHACGAVQNMVVGPPGSAGSSRSQTTLSCCIVRDIVVSVREKARDGHVRFMEVNESEPLWLSVDRGMLSRNYGYSLAYRTKVVE